MGLNMCMLYTEDTYEVPGEPFFGYLRGRYSQAEMKELDRYAASLGIEMFPCIQTLAHLEQILQWPAYAQYKDTNSVLLADEDATYALHREDDTRGVGALPLETHPHRHGRGDGHRRRGATGRNSATWTPSSSSTATSRAWAAICKRLGLEAHDLVRHVFPHRLEDARLLRQGLRHPEGGRGADTARRAAGVLGLLPLDAAFYEDWIERHRAHRRRARHGGRRLDVEPLLVRPASSPSRRPTRA